MKDWSLVFPTRERSRKLANLFGSMWETAADLSRVEVLIAVDDDDVETHDWLDSFPWPVANGLVRAFTVPRARNFSTEYYNMLAERSCGRLIMALNDDVRFATKGWDDARLPAGAWYGRCSDLRVGGAQYHTLTPYACFPVLTREAWEVQGYLQHPAFTGWGADVFLGRVWHAVFGGDRVVQLPFAVTHDLPSEQVQPDAAHLYMRSVTEYHYELMPGEALRLERAIKEKNL